MLVRCLASHYSPRDTVRYNIIIWTETFAVEAPYPSSRMSQIPTALHIPVTDQHSLARAEKLFGSSLSLRGVAIREMSLYLSTAATVIIHPRKPRKPLLLLVPEPG